MMAGCQGMIMIVVVVMTAMLSRVDAWGKTGHEITGAVAQALLRQDDAAVLDKVLDILGGESMSDAAPWADEIKRQHGWAWSKPLHYINTKSWECGFDPLQDCRRPCLSSAIQNFTSQLVSRSVDDLSIPMKFLIHLLGDAHQPLHVGFAVDEGGNLIHGEFFRRHTELHAIWDDYLIYHRLRNDLEMSQDDYVTYLVDAIHSNWTKGDNQWVLDCTLVDCPVLWAKETAKLACQYAYVESDGTTPVPNDFRLSDPYYERTKLTIDRQLAKAGVRIAQTMKNIYKQQVEYLPKIIIS